MSITPATQVSPASPAGPAPRRVRHQARDVVALMTFSAVVSIGCALSLLLLAQLGR